MAAATPRKKKPVGRKPWYADGLRFSCLPECGACCTTHDSYAYVYLEPDDVQRLCAHLGLSERAFVESYTTLDDGELALKIDEPDCPFLDGWRCSVYEARPTQCRTFPFWSETLKSRAAWERLRRFCPGIGEGEVHPLETIRGYLGERDAD